MLKVGREGSQTASELKRRALVNALISYVVFPTCQRANKDLIIRVLSQLTDPELVVLSHFVRGNDLMRWFYDDKSSDAWIEDKDLAERFKRPLPEVRAACEGLQQIGLLYDALAGRTDYVRGLWSLTELAQQLIEFALDDQEPQETPAE